MSRLILGCGYLGYRVAKIWQKRGEQVFAVTRSDERRESFARSGLQPILADVTDADSLSPLRDLNDVQTVLVAIGMDRSRYDRVRDVYVEGLKNVLQQFSSDARPRHLIYVSSTGVYGDFGGEWVDESSKTEPVREGGQACLEAEHLLKQSVLSDRTTILRFAGIYGPGRVPTRSTIESGSWSKLSADGFLNLIHVDDGARLIEQLADEHAEAAGELYCVSDGHPVIRKDYYDQIAQELGLDSIPWTKVSVDQTKARSGSNKRVSNLKLTRQFDFSFEFEDYRAGVRHSIGKDSSPPA
ncbi:MAG: SDR family oxidoreductase [Planctomycetota bacterium]